MYVWYTTNRPAASSLPSQGSLRFRGVPKFPSDDLGVGQLAGLVTGGSAREPWVVPYGGLQAGGCSAGTTLVRVIYKYILVCKQMC